MGASQFSAVVLAAGASVRMGDGNKLLLPLGSEPVIRRTVRAVLGARPVELVVVTGFERDAVGRALGDLPVRAVHNPAYRQGQMSSVSAGVAALSAPVEAIMVCLGDMPLLGSNDYGELLEAFACRPRGSILVPRRNGVRGNPVVLAGAHASAMIAGGRDLGCRKLIADHPDEVCAYEAAHDRFFVDLDSPEDYAVLLRRLGIAAPQAVLAS